jgi:iron complex outermembrane receptor protein
MTILLCAAFAATNVTADLPSVTVYAARAGATADALAGAVQVFDADFIAQAGAQSLPDLLEKKADVEIRTLNGNPLQSQVALRGFGENSFGRVKVLFDGEELNAVDMFAPNLARVALGSVERVEVIRGPSPVLHGDGAVAGVINVLTSATEVEPLRRVSVRGGSFGTAGVALLLRGAAGEDNLSYSAAADGGRSDGFRDRSAYDLFSFDAALHRTFEQGAFWRFKLNLAQAFYEMPGAVSRDVWASDRRAAAYQHDWCRLWNAGVGFESKAHLADDQWLTLDGRFSFQRRRSHWGDARFTNDYNLYGLSFSPRYVNETAVAGFGNTLTVGADLRVDRDAITDRSGWNNPSYHFDRLRTALFAQDDFDLSETLSVVAGVRVEAIDNRWTHYRGLQKANGCDWATDAELGAVWRPLDGFKAYAKGTRFHRSPFCDELASFPDGRLLEPETGWSLDVGVDWTLSEEISLMTALYGMMMDDEIFYNPYLAPGEMGWNGSNCNSPARTRRLGFETALAWRRERTAEASVRYSAVRADFAEGPYHGCDVPLVPRQRVRVEAGVYLGDSLKVTGGCRFTADRRLMGDFANAHGELGGFTLFDLAVHYTPPWAEAWRISLVVDNLFDRDFCDFAGWSDWSGAYYYPACGRSFLVTLCADF